MTEDVPSNDDLKEATQALASQMAQKRRERIKEALADWVWALVLPYGRWRGARADGASAITAVR
jgi:predicted transcriptional regulator